MMKWIKEHDGFLRALSLLLAIFLWAYVMGNKNPNKTVEYRGIPVQLDGLTQLNTNDLVVLEGGDNQVTVNVEGDRSSILEMSRDYVSAVASITHITEPGEYDLNYRVTLDATGVKVASRNPGKVHIVVDRISKASIPVELEITGKPADGYVMATSPRTYPDAVTIKGPSTLLEQVKRARVSYDVSETTGTTQTVLTYQLLDASGNEITDNRISAESPSVTLTVTMKKNGSIPLTVNLENHEYLKSTMVTVDIEPQSIQLIGATDTMLVLNQISLGTIDLADVVENEQTVFTIPIVLPNGVSAEAGTPVSARVTVTAEGYSRRTLSLTPAVLGEDPLLEYPEDQLLEVTVFGPTEKVEALTEEALQVRPEYRLIDLIAGENIISCRVTPVDSGIYVFQKTQVIGVVTQEALDAVMLPPNSGDSDGEPDRDGEPAEPTEP